jgi:type II secretion system protein G
MSTPGRSRRIGSGFTLIELLIVVAIVVLLAAIALPNFLEAHERAKVSRVKSDLRTLSGALEAYAVDNGAYPPATDEKGAPIAPYPPVGLGPEAFETRLSAALTTPIAHLGALPIDPFHAQKPDEEDPRIFEGPGYHYGLDDYALANDGPEGKAKFQFFVWMLGGRPHGVRFFVSSHGPDRDHDDDEDLFDIHAATAYDPTNGTLSSGDIVRMGPGGGFGN